jgi:hypothetical protein
MALVKATLKSEISAGVKAIDLANADVADEIAGVIADAIDSYIKAATITVTAGIPVATAGSAVAQTGATTGPGTATIS